MPRSRGLFFCLAPLLLASVFSYLNVEIANVGYSYAVDMTIGSTSYRTVVDTGSYELVSRNMSYTLERNISSFSSCLSLSVDGTSAQYLVINSPTCSVTMNTTSIGSATATVPVSNSEYLVLQNGQLHDWLNTTGGTVGLTYQCSDSSCSQTAFQSLLANADPSSSTTQTFGLDFRDPNSTIASLNSTQSSMQLAGVSTDFAADLIWQTLTSTTPSYHQIFIDNVDFCGIPILGNYSSNWQVLIDSGAACLTLPGEIYDTFATWFNSSIEVNSWADLPALSFNVFGNDQALYLPLGTLVVANDAIHNEDGAPYITSTQQGSARLCVLRGPNIENDYGDYTVPTPTIVFGSMALRAFYFAADFGNRTVALAPKLSSSEIAYYRQANQSCAVASRCTGLQSYNPAANTCQAPRCKQYYFEQLDSTGTQCEYRASAVGFGLFFISFIAAMEFVSYFLNQYTAHHLLQSRDLQGTAVKVDWLAYSIGQGLSCVVDGLLQAGQQRPLTGGRTRPQTGDYQQNILLREV